LKILVLDDYHRMKNENGRTEIRVNPQPQRRGSPRKIMSEKGNERGSIWGWGGEGKGREAGTGAEQDQDREQEQIQEREQEQRQEREQEQRQEREQERRQRQGQERDHQTRAEPLAKPGAGLDGDLKVVPTTAGLRSVGDTPHPGGGHRRVATMAAGTVRDGGVCCGC
ncbi:hypothetical protein WR25_09407, partial [Diploscapter pachys]